MTSASSTPKERIEQLLDELRNSDDPVVRSRFRQLSVLVGRAQRSADLTRTQRGSDAWTEEFVRVLEGGRPISELAVPFAHTMVVNRPQDATPEQIDKLRADIHKRASQLRARLREQGY